MRPLWLTWCPKRSAWAITASWGSNGDAGVGERALCVLGFGERHGEQEVAGRGVGHGITSVDGSCWVS